MLWDSRPYRAAPALGRAGPLPVVEVFAGEGEVLVQRVRLVPGPVREPDPKHVAFPTGHLGDKLISQPVLAGRVPEALQAKS